MMPFFRNYNIPTDISCYRSANTRWQDTGLGVKKGGIFSPPETVDLKKRSFPFGEVVAPLIAIPNVDKANRRQEKGKKAKLALHVIRMQKGDSRVNLCKLLGRSSSTDLHYGWV